MSTIKLRLFFALVTLLPACTTVSYFGDSYFPTSSVDFFYDETTIPRNYEIIGHALGDGARMDRIKEKLFERAQQEGADAILVRGIYKEKYPINDAGVVISSDQVEVLFLKYR